MTRASATGRNAPLAVGGLLVFTGILVFLAVAHPAVPFDGDDWRYLSEFRPPIPVPGIWNPSRILPEILMPLVGSFAAACILPIVGDYLTSITLAVALAVAAFSLVFYVSLVRLLAMLGIGRVAAAMLGILMVLLYFAMFKSRPESVHMLHAGTSNLYFFYVIPNLLNSSLVLMLMRRSATLPTPQIDPEASPRSHDWVDTGTLVACIYLAIFSMAYSAAILAVFAAVAIGRTGLASWRMGNGLTGTLRLLCRDQAWMLAIAVLFLTALAFEATGARANWNDGSTTSAPLFSYEFVHRFVASWRYFFALLDQIPRPVLVILALPILVATVIHARRRKSESTSPAPGLAVMSICCCLLLAPFYMLLSAKAGPEYGGMITAVHGVFFFGILLSILSVAYVFSCFPKSLAALPLLVVFVLAYATNSRNYFGTGPWGMTTAEMRNDMAGLILQIQSADRSGQSGVALRVPRFRTSDNWPMPPEWYGSVLSRTLHAHRMISRPMDVQVEVADPDSRSQ